MSLNTPDWENRLYHLAYQGRTQHSQPLPMIDTRVLAQAYAHCASLTKSHSRTFFLASELLPKRKRAAVRVLYAFCRVSDDLVDRPGENPLHALDEWQRRISGNGPHDDKPVALAWADVRSRYRIPPAYPRQLVEGIRDDLSQTRYEDFTELAAYAYRVASTVGLMSMHIIGYTGDEAFPYAVKMGVALQLTNILRDVAEDWQAGRLYLPQDELAAFGLTEGDIAAGSLTPNWQAFMAFQIERNRRLYDEAWPGITFLDPDGRLAIGAAARLYAGILDDIEGHNYDVFTRRAYVSHGRKIGMLPGIWQKVRRI